MKNKISLKRALTVIMILSLMACLLAACGKKQGEGITVYAGNTIFDSSLDPVKGGMSYGYSFTNDGLIKLDENGKYVGSLADSWQVSDNGLEYTFVLKEGIKFHNGKEMTGRDVVFTYQTVKENQGKNENVDLSRLDTVEAIGNEVKFTLSEPYSSFLDQTALLGIVPSEAYDSEEFDTKPIGTGPWKIIQYDTEQKIILEANKEYHDGKPSIPRVTIVKMDPEAAIANAKSGDLDVVMVESTYAKEKVKDMHIENLKTIDVRQISLPVTKEATYVNEKGEEIKVGNNVSSDPAVREALNIGINRENIIKNSLNGIGKPAFGFTSDFSWANPVELEDGKAEEAKSIMEAAGWEKAKDGIYEKSGIRCAFTVIAPSTDTERYQLAVAVAEEAKKIGIDIKVEQKTWDEIPKESACNGVIWGWGQYDPVVLKKLFHSKEFSGGGFANTVRYENKEVDKEIEAALGASNREDVTSAWKAVQSRVAKEHPYIYIVNIEHSYFVKDNLDISIDTQIAHPHGHGAPVINNMKDWKLK